VVDAEYVTGLAIDGQEVVVSAQLERGTLGKWRMEAVTFRKRLPKPVMVLEAWTVSRMVRGEAGTKV
jgi:hypothetical protein